MVHEYAQPTLEPTPELRVGDFIASTSLSEAATWLAFERSTRLNAPVTTSLRLTLELLRVLEKQGVLRRDVHGRSPEVRRAIYDPVSWTCAVAAPNPDELEALLLSRTRDLSRRPEVRGEKIGLWHALAYAEAESYFAVLLRKHGFDPTWSELIHARLEHEWSAQPLARRRYLIWAGVRQGAAVYMQSGGDLAQAFSAIETELRRRGRWLAANASDSRAGKFYFFPYPSWTRPLLLDIYLTEIRDSPDGYWTEAMPSFAPQS